MRKEFKTVNYQVENNIAYITMNRSEALNSLNYEIAADLLAATELAQDKEIRAVLLSGKGKAFCAGGDIKLMTTIDDDPNLLLKLLETLNQVAINIRNLDKPVVAAVHGFAMGAGLSLALAADFRIAARSAGFSCAFVNIGLVPDTGASYFLTKILGYAKATELMMLGETFNADQALSMGLVNRVVPDEEVKTVAVKLAEKLSKKPAGSIAAIKNLINKALISELSDQLALEAIFQKEAGKTANFREGITAFTEKRKPEFNK